MAIFLMCCIRPRLEAVRRYVHPPTRPVKQVRFVPEACARVFDLNHVAAGDDRRAGAR